jgi:hypothetical protein
MTARTQANLAEAFAEWDRRYREDPEGFMNEVQHLLGETPDSYGAAAAQYFNNLFEEMFDIPLVRWEVGGEECSNEDEDLPYAIDGAATSLGSLGSGLATPEHPTGI